jgi:hypothetical protein
MRTQAQIIKVFDDLLLHIIEGLEGRRARSRSRSSGFDSVLGSGRRAVESQVLMESIS